jgi:uncharacterized protein with ParB-like and HNH nuclease domain
MADKIDSGKLLVKDVFTKWYRIPEYQRPYVWGSDQVNELLTDILQARNANPDSEYFLGSLVLKKHKKEEGSTKYEEYDVLDGQQRLTILLLITAVIRDLTPKNNESRLKACRESIYQIASPDDNIPERMRIVFDIRDKVKDFVNEFIKTEGGTLKTDELESTKSNGEEDISIRNMANTILLAKKFFESPHMIDDFFPFLRSNVLVIYVATEELEDAFHLFTVMNNRGIKLRNSDILKAENLAIVPDVNTRTKYAKYWEEIEEYFADDFDNFLSHLRMILVKTKAGYNLLKEYEDNIYNPKEFDRNTKTYSRKPPLLEKGSMTFDFIERYYKHYQELFELDNHALTNSFEFYNLLTVMRVGFEADFWVAPLLRFYDKYKTNRLVDFTKSLNNKFSADWITGLTPTDRIENNNTIIDAIDKSQSINEVLSSTALSINKDDVMRVLCSNVYGRRYARYMLLKLDNAYLASTNKISIPEMISIEHILPQIPDQKSQWVADFNDTKREFWTNKLGNLVLISRRKNSSQGNSDYDKKKEKYFRNNIELFANSVRVLNQNIEWKEDNIQKNHKAAIITLALSYGFQLSDAEYNQYSGVNP